MFDKIKELEDRFMQLEGDLTRPEIIKDQKTYQKFSKEHSQLSPIINAFRKHKAV